MDLAERGGGGGVELELGEPVAPARPELGGHAPAHERPAHRRRLRLQLRELGGVLLGQRLGDRREQLGDLHQRPLEAAERRPQLLGVGGAVDRDAEEARAGEPRREAAHRAGDLGVAPHPPAERVLRPAARAVGHAQAAIASSSWSISASIMPSPLAQKPGSEASRPNGASSSW